MDKLDDSVETLPGVKESRRALNFESGCRQVGLVLLLIIVISAVLGFFSDGYFSSAQKSNSVRTLNVDYERFGRLQMEFKYHFKIHSPDTDNYTLSLGGVFTEDFQPGDITPQPDKMYSQGERLYLVYENVKTKGDFSVWMYATPTRPGKLVTAVQVNNEPELHFWQFIYP